MQKKVILCILDGFGLGDKNYKYNAIFQSKTPNIQRILEEYPNTTLQTSGLAVGLPEGQMGNSEVGHMTIGSGRVVYQDLPRINLAMENGDLAAKLKDSPMGESIGNNVVHLVGLCSAGGVHSSLEHIKFIYKTLENLGRTVFLHIITDGRDVPPSDFIHHIKEFEGVNIATISGRFFAMDRDNKSERTDAYFTALCGKSQEKFGNIADATKDFYSRKITDEFFEPSVIGDFGGIKQGDSIFFANFRADRMRQITQVAIDSQLFSNITCLTQYSAKIAKQTTVLFTQNKITNTLSDVMESHQKKHLHIAETEKYAHVTFFFNGGREAQGEFEERILIQSPNVKTYDLKPEMSLYELSNKLLQKIEEQSQDFIVINIANGDMVGHTGNFEASKQAAEHIDLFVANLKNASLDNGYDLLITADHGNLEEMVDEKTGEIHTQHTTGPVPLILISKNSHTLKDGTLANVAPTVLDLMGIKKPEEMVESLLD